jgi:acyl-CoA synthetase (AMP-forming)/AMP-acid ligase II
LFSSSAVPVHTDSFSFLPVARADEEERASPRKPVSSTSRLNRFRLFSADDRLSLPSCSVVDSALKQCPGVEHVLVLQRTGGKVGWVDGRDAWWHEETAKVSSVCPCEVMASEDPLFILYVSLPYAFDLSSSSEPVLISLNLFHQTSGSTGKPKGVVHTTGGYLLGAALTVKYVFDVHPGDKFFCGSSRFSPLPLPEIEIAHGP